MREFIVSALAVLPLAVALVSTSHAASTAPVAAPAVPAAGTITAPPVPELPTTAMMLPFYEGRTDVESLRAFNNWVERRASAGSDAVAITNGADAALDQLCDQRDTEVREALDLVGRLRGERETLRKQSVAARAAGQPVASFAARYAKLPPVPTRAAILPHFLESSGTTTPATGAGGSPPGSTSATVLPSSTPAAQPGWDGLIERLTQDGVALGNLLNIAQQSQMQATQSRTEAQSRMIQQVNEIRRSIMSKFSAH